MFTHGIRKPSAEDIETYGLIARGVESLVPLKQQLFAATLKILQTEQQKSLNGTAREGVAAYNDKFGAQSPMVIQGGITDEELDALLVQADIDRLEALTELSSMEGKINAKLRGRRIGLHMSNLVLPKFTPIIFSNQRLSNGSFAQRLEMGSDGVISGTLYGLRHDLPYPVTSYLLHTLQRPPQEVADISTLVVRCDEPILGSAAVRDIIIPAFVNYSESAESKRRWTLTFHPVAPRRVKTWYRPGDMNRLTPKRFNEKESSYQVLAKKYNASGQ